MSESEQSAAVTLRVVPARDGWKWLAEGLRFFRASPGMWTLLVVAYWMLIALMNRIGPVGSIIVAICLPAFSASFSVICDEIRRGHVVRPALLFAGFQRHPRAALALGVVYLGSITVILALSALADGGTLMDWILFNKAPTEADLTAGKLSLSLPVAAVLATPVLMAFWFAPLLVVFEHMPASKSLFYSFFACLRNWRALFMYGGAVTLFAMFIAMFVAMFAVMAGGNPHAARGFMLAATIMIMPALFGSFYAAYADIFPRDEAPRKAEVEVE
ncbi:MAG: hypothetical protein EXR28_02175 [Betaproteobacteria bacterium]|nr:hypothetical protein [Betaproteobacteria bacterium]